MPSELYTDAELETGTEALGPVPACDDARRVLSVAAPMIAARERARIDTALRALPCPDPERPGARIAADEHYRWMTEVLRVVNATTPITKEDQHADA